MRFHPRQATLAVLCALATAAAGQDRSDWQSLAQLRPGDTIRLSLKTGSVNAAFRDFAPQQVTAGNVTAKKEDVLKVERYRKGGRGKAAAIGAVIGFGAGFTIGAATGGGCGHSIGPCLSRGALGGILGGVGAILGAGVGALLPRRSTELIYAVK